MDNEINILVDIYADVINHIEYVKTSRKRIMNINNSIQFVDNELARLQAQASILQTARVAYSKELQNELNPLGGGDTIKF